MRPMQKLPRQAHALVVSGKFDECWQNHQYEALVKRGVNCSPFPPMTWLSIKRRGDKSAVRDWRHLQEIKNDICGPEVEGVELYPAESRKLDEANQFHIWVLEEQGARWPFGQDYRCVLGPEHAKKVGAVQRPIREGDRYCEQTPNAALTRGGKA